MDIRVDFEKSVKVSLKLVFYRCFSETIVNGALWWRGNSIMISRQMAVPPWQRTPGPCVCEHISWPPRRAPSLWSHAPGEDAILDWMMLWWEMLQQGTDKTGIEKARKEMWRGREAIVSCLGRWSVREGREWGLQESFVLWESENWLPMVRVVTMGQ